MSPFRPLLWNYGIILEEEEGKTLINAMFRSGMYQATFVTSDTDADI